MTISIIDVAQCRGCDAPVYVTRDRSSGREIVRDDLGATMDGPRLWGMPGPRHLCADPALRERIELSAANVAERCRECGSIDVAVSTWGRLVECPYPTWASADWSDQHEAHVCLVRRAQRTDTRQRAVTPDLEQFAIRTAS